MMREKPDTYREAAYFDYLSGRSPIGLLYRNYFLYPVLSRMLHGRVLDYGCGIGDFLRYRKHSVGVDINRQLVTYCQSRGHDVRLVRDDRIPYPESSFDSVMMDNVIEHINAVDADKVIKEIMRVLRPDGTLLIGIPGRKGYASDADHKCFYTCTDLDVLISRHGGSLAKVKHMPLRFPGVDKYLRQYCIYAAFRKTDPI